MNGKELKQVLEKFLKAESAGEARMENKLFGVRETHRLVFTVKAETWNMGKVLKKL